MIEFKKGDRPTARQMTEIARGAHVGENYTGENAIVDKDGVHVRKVPQAVRKDLEFFMAVVVSYNPTTGLAQCQEAIGPMSNPQPKDLSEIPFAVWMGIETCVRGVMDNGGVYDMIMCHENPIESERGACPYVGFMMMPGFAYAMPTTNLSAAQDIPGVLQVTV
jgi:hypothetical protein